ANSEVERFNRTVEKAIRAANVEGKNWKEELDVFLLNYCSTPHCTTGKPPAVLLFGRNIRNKISVPPASTPADDIPVTVRQHDRERKEKIKSYADDHNRASSFSVSLGKQNCRRPMIRSRTLSKKRKGPVCYCNDPLNDRL
ncbi:Transposon Ty3-I Gag-Pol poly, partial [Paramuricea clavata]